MVQFVPTGRQHECFWLPILVLVWSNMPAAIAQISPPETVPSLLENAKFGSTKQLSCESATAPCFDSLTVDPSTVNDSVSFNASTISDQEFSFSVTELEELQDDRPPNTQTNLSASISIPQSTRTALDIASDSQQETDSDNTTSSSCASADNIQVIGCTVLTSEIQAVIERYAGRVLTPAELSSLRDEITFLYIQEGYITSRVEEVKVVDRTVQVMVQEGYLECIVIRATINGREGNTSNCNSVGTPTNSNQSAWENGIRERIRSYVDSRVLSTIGTPLNVNLLEEQLRLLRNDTLASSDPLFGRLETILSSGSSAGASRLTVEVEEAEVFQVDFEVNNYAPPSLGSERIQLNLRLFRPLASLQNADSSSSNSNSERNPLNTRVSWVPSGEVVSIAAIGDFPDLSSVAQEDPFDAAFLETFFRIPLNETPGQIQFRTAWNRNQITEAPFDDLDLVAESRLQEVTYRHALSQTLRGEFALSLGLAVQNGQTFVFNDVPTPLGIGPDEEGRSRTSVIQLGTDYIRREANSSFWFGQLQFSAGTGLFNATTNEGSIPDGQFISLFGRMQRMQRFSNNHSLVLRAEAQLTPNSLLPSQQFTIGGYRSVRGYRESARAGDNGVVVSLENRIAIASETRDREQRTVLEIIPFVDLGVVWNHPNNPNELTDQNFLASAGMGIRWYPWRNLEIRADYGVPVIDLNDRGRNFQDRGLHMSVAYRLRF